MWSVYTRVLLVCPLFGGLSSFGVSFIGGFTVFPSNTQFVPLFRIEEQIVLFVSWRVLYQEDSTKICWKFFQLTCCKC